MTSASASARACCTRLLVGHGRLDLREDRVLHLVGGLDVRRVQRVVGLGDERLHVRVSLVLRVVLHLFARHEHARLLAPGVAVLAHPQDEVEGSFAPCRIGRPGLRHDEVVGVGEVAAVARLEDLQHREDVPLEVLRLAVGVDVPDAFEVHAELAEAEAFAFAHRPVRADLVLVDGVVPVLQALDARGAVEGGLLEVRGEQRAAVLVQSAVPVAVEQDSRQGDVRAPRARGFLDLLGVGDELGAVLRLALESRFGVQVGVVEVDDADDDVPGHGVALAADRTAVPRDRDEVLLADAALGQGLVEGVEQLLRGHGRQVAGVGDRHVGRRPARDRRRELRVVVLGDEGDLGLDLRHRGVRVLDHGLHDLAVRAAEQRPVLDRDCLARRRAVRLPGREGQARGREQRQQSDCNAFHCAPPPFDTACVQRTLLLASMPDPASRCA